MQLESDITRDLYEWGKWARNCPVKSISYPHQTPFNKFRGAGIGASRAITDDYALELDQAIAKLFNGDKETITLIIGHYQYCLSYRDIERLTGISKDKARLLVENATSWINGYFVGLRTAA